QGRAELDVHEPAVRAGGALQLLRQGHRLAEGDVIPAVRRAVGQGGGGAGGAGEKELERGPAGSTAGDGELGDLAGRVAARLEAGEQRLGPGLARAEHGRSEERRVGEGWRWGGGAEE